VYNEGASIVRVLESLRRSVTTPFRVLICYDHDDDDTLIALRDYRADGFQLRVLKNQGRGALDAVVQGLQESSAPAVVVFPADDDYNGPYLDRMMAKFREGCEIVVASRFAPGGCMVGAPWLKAALIRTSAFLLHYLAHLPTRDPSNGFRLFSQRILETIPIESSVGFAYSIELLVKCHRLRWRIGEVPVAWYQRQSGQSRFQVLAWLPQYLVWFRYAFATTFLGRGPETVHVRERVIL
jgi:glycosyltransferase involved in cell wall biosynthesis